MSRFTKSVWMSVCVPWYTYVAGSVIGVFVAAAGAAVRRSSSLSFIVTLVSFLFDCESYTNIHRFQYQIPPGHQVFSSASLIIFTAIQTKRHTQRVRQKDTRTQCFLAVKYANFITYYIYHLMCKYSGLSPWWLPLAVCRYFFITPNWYAKHEEKNRQTITIIVLILREKKKPTKERKKKTVNLISSYSHIHVLECRADAVYKYTNTSIYLSCRMALDIFICRLFTMTFIILSNMVTIVCINVPFIER